MLPSIPGFTGALMGLILLLTAATEANARDRSRDVPRIYQEAGPIVEMPAMLGGSIGRGIGTVVGAPMVILATPLSLITMGQVSPFFPVRWGRAIGGTLGPHFGGMPAYLPKALLIDTPTGVYHSLSGS